MRLADLAHDARSRVLPRHPSGSRIEVVDLGDLEVAVHDAQMTQVLANLLGNAIQAIPKDREARIAVKIGPGAPGMARIEVTDNGVGMEPDVVQRVFDPFFSTREVGKGMGLGLSVCHSIVEAHGGTITVRSEPGKGSTFTVELPVAGA